jgi:hypothetical protein
MEHELIRLSGQQLGIALMLPVIRQKDRPQVCALLRELEAKGRDIRTAMRSHGKQRRAA